VEYKNLHKKIGNIMLNLRKKKAEEIPDLTGITKLDLGDTYHGEGEPLEPGWTSIALDETDKFVGDYTKTLYPDNSFEYAYGSCYLEFDENIPNLDLEIPLVDNPAFEEGIISQFTELFRILRPGGRAELSGCMGFEEGDWGSPEEERQELQRLNSLLQMYGKLAQRIGFIVDLSQWKMEQQIDTNPKTSEKYPVLCAVSSLII